MQLEQLACLPEDTHSQEECKIYSVLQVGAPIPLYVTMCRDKLLGTDLPANKSEAWGGSILDCITFSDFLYTIKVKNDEP